MSAPISATSSAQATEMRRTCAPDSSSRWTPPSRRRRPIAQQSKGCLPRPGCCSRDVTGVSASSTDQGVSSNLGTRSVAPTTHHHDTSPRPAAHAGRIEFWVVNKCPSIYEATELPLYTKSRFEREHPSSCSPHIRVAPSVTSGPPETLCGTLSFRVSGKRPPLSLAALADV